MHVTLTKNDTFLTKVWLSLYKKLHNPTDIKVHIFWEGHTFLRNLHRRFVLCSNGQIYGGDFAKYSQNIWTLNFIFCLFSIPQALWEYLNDLSTIFNLIISSNSSLISLLFSSFFFMILGQHLQDKSCNGQRLYWDANVRSRTCMPILAPSIASHRQRWVSCSLWPQMLLLSHRKLQGPQIQVGQLPTVSSLFLVRPYWFWA